MSERCPVCDEATVCGHEFHEMINKDEVERLVAEAKAGMRLAAAELIATSKVVSGGSQEVREVFANYVKGAKEMILSLPDEAADRALAEHVERAVMQERSVWTARESEGYRQSLMRRVTEAEKKAEHVEHAEQRARLPLQNSLNDVKQKLEKFWPDAQEEVFADSNYGWSTIAKVAIDAAIEDAVERAVAIARLEEAKYSGPEPYIWCALELKWRPARIAELAAAEERVVSKESTSE